MKRGSLVALVVFGVVLATRLPYAAHTLWAHDSVLYANAIERGFHVDDELLQQRPHPPGYILYVASASAAHALGLDSNGALVAVSAVASALGAALLFLLARRRVSDRVALVAAMAYAANPLVWHYSEIAYPYAVLGLGSLVVATVCIRARRGDLRGAVVASVAFGIAGGFRQDLLVLLFPLWVWCVAPLGARRAAVAAAAVAITCAVWLAPTVVLSGGPLDYFDALQSQAAYVRDAYSVTTQGIPAFVANLAATSWAVGWGLFAMLPLVTAAVLAVARRAGRDGRVDDGAALLIWTLPPLALYVTLHIGDWGYVLSALPGLYVLGAQALGTVLAAVRPRRLALGASWATLVAVPAMLFTASSLPFSAAAVASHDNELGARVSYVREHYQPRATLILTREDFLLVRYYLPEFRSRQYDPEPFIRTSRRMRAGRAERVVIFTQGLVPDRQPDVRRVQCNKKGVELVYIDVVPGSILEFRGERYAVAQGAPDYVRP